MAALRPRKFAVDQSLQHLLCPICQRPFEEPMISVKCGHSFCKQCCVGTTNGKNAGICPIDNTTCEQESLVINRVLVEQVNNLLVYCIYGLKWSEELNDYILDQDGCQLTIKLGERDEHEEMCEYALVPCPNNRAACGLLRRRDLPSHISSCDMLSCQHKSKGCQFVGSKLEVEQHHGVCGYHDFASPVLSSCSYELVQVEGLEKRNLELERQVENLAQRVHELEDSKAVMQHQLLACKGECEKLHEMYEDLLERVQRWMKSRTNASVRSDRSCIRATSPGGTREVRRLPSTSSLSSLVDHRVESWVMPFTFTCIGTLRGHRGIVTSMKVWGHLLFSSGGDSLIKVWDLEALAKGCLRSMAGHTEKVTCLALGEHELFSGSSDKSIRSWSFEDMNENKVIKDAHDDTIVAMVTSDTYLFTSSMAEIKVWEVGSLKCLHTISGLYHWVRALALNYSRDKLYSGTHNTIEIWDATGKFNMIGKISHNYGSIYSLAVTSQYIIAGTYNRNIQVYDVRTQTHVDCRLSGHIGAVPALELSLSGRYLFSGSSDSSIQIWELENMLPIQSLKRHEDGVNCLALHNDLLLSGSDDHEIKVYKYFHLMR